MKEIQTMLDATAKRVCDEVGLDPSFATIENRIAHVNIHVETPRLPLWPLTMSPGPEHLDEDCAMEIDRIEHILGVLARAHLALQHAHDRFQGPPPLWATGVHPLVGFAIDRSSYSPEEIVKESRSPAWRPEEREEHLLGEKTGLHLEVKMLRFGNGLKIRARGTYSSLDVQPMTDTTRTGIVGRSLAEVMDCPADIADLLISSAVDRPNEGTTRLTVWGDLVPIEEPPAGEDPWWIATWSDFQDLAMERHRHG